MPTQNTSRYSECTGGEKTSPVDNPRANKMLVSGTIVVKAIWLGSGTPVTCHEKRMLRVAASPLSRAQQEPRDLNPPAAGLDQPQLGSSSRTLATIQYRPKSTETNVCYFKTLSFTVAYYGALLWHLLTTAISGYIRIQNLGLSGSRTYYLHYVEFSQLNY